MKKNIAIIGSGFSSLSAACYLSKSGHKVTVYEKNDSLGGRARQFKEKGFTFDMGPSWYWMPDVFDKFFNDFGRMFLIIIHSLNLIPDTEYSLAIMILLI